MEIRSSDFERLGLSRSQLMSRVRRGEAREVRPGVWSLAEAAPTPEQRHLELVRATWRGLRPGAVLSHASAAAVHGLPAPRRALERVHITRPGRSGRVSRFVHLHRGHVEAADVVEVGGLAVTGLLRTALDCALLLDPMDGLAVLDAALARGLDRGAALDRLAAAGPRRGSARARAVVTHADGLAESAGESWSRWRMIELQVPLPRLQVPVVDADGVEVARPDFRWDDARLVGEFDGQVKYGRLLRPGQDVADVVLAEKAREERIRRAGFWVVRWTAAELFPAARFRSLLSDAWRAGGRAA